MRAFRLLLALTGLLWAGVAAGGMAAACDVMGAKAGISLSAAVAPAMHAHAHAVAAETHQADASADHRHHPGPHQHDHGCPQGCCVLCCNVAVPHVLVPAPEIFLDIPVIRPFAVPRSTEVAVKAVWLPYRPPRIV